MDDKGDFQCMMIVCQLASGVCSSDLLKMILLGYILNNIFATFVTNTQLKYFTAIDMGQLAMAKTYTGCTLIIKGKLELARLSLINIHVEYLECKHVFHFCISRAVLYIIFPMSL